MRRRALVDRLSPSHTWQVTLVVQPIMQRRPSASKTQPTLIQPGLKSFGSELVYLNGFVRLSTRKTYRS